MAATLTPELREESLEVQVKKINSKNDKGSVMDTILKNLCGLLNNRGGGCLTVRYEECEKPDLRINDEDFLRSVEQKISEKFGGLSLATDIIVENRENSTIFRVNGAANLITLRYNTSITTASQVLSVSSKEPIDRVRKLLKPRVQQLLTHARKDHYIWGEVIGKESLTAEFKNLKAEPTKCVSLSDRIVSKGTKLVSYVAAFGNGCGGSIYFGVRDNGVVNGEKVSEHEMDAIIKKVSKAVRNMRSSNPSEGYQLQRGKHWDITFVPVKDVDGHPIPSTFVIVVSVASCSGGIFTEAPESYQVVEGKLEKMDFPTWKEKISEGEDDVDHGNQYNMVITDSPSGNMSNKRNKPEKKWVDHPVTSRPTKLFKWNSKQDEMNYAKRTMVRERFRKSGEWDLFYEELQQPLDPTDIDGELIAIFQTSSEAIMQGKLLKAKKIFARFSSRKGQSKNSLFFELDEIYFHLVLHRAGSEAHDFETLLSYAGDGVRVLSSTQPCVTSAWLYCEIGLTFSICACNSSDGKTFDSLISEAKNYASLAIQHARQLQSLLEVSCDIQWKARVIMAMLCLGTTLNGVGLNAGTSVSVVDLAQAREHLDATKELLRQGPPYAYNQCLRYLAECDYWERDGQINPQKAEERTEKAASYAKRGLDLAILHHFDELCRYALNRSNKFVASPPRQNHQRP